MSIDHASALEVATSASRDSVSRHDDSWGGPTRGSEFITTAHRTARCRELADDGYLVARVVPSLDTDGGDGAVRRSELRNALEGAVEISLALRGALPPSVDIGAPVRDSAKDQVDRLRKLGASGLCLVLPELAAISDADTLLSPEDSAALEAWREIAEDHPVVLLFDEGDRALKMLAPRRLDEVFPTPESSPTSWPDDARSLLDQTPTDQPDVTTEVEAGWDDDGAPADDEPPAEETPPAEEQPTSGDEETQATTQAPVDLTGNEPTIAYDPMHDAPTRPGKRVMASDPLAGLDLDSDSDPGEPIQRTLFEDDASAEGSSLGDRPPSHGSAPSHHSTSSVASSRCSAATAGSYRNGSSRGYSSHGGFARAQRAIAPQPRLNAAEVAQLCERLERAEGPKPVSVIQELFTECYIPLLEALSCGLNDNHAERVVDDWRQSFEKSYGEGFNTMRLTGRRPAMVLDAPEIATKIGKLNGARAAQLLLVDGMRYDLGTRVHDELAELLDGTAECVDQPVLWSALPSVTPVQMHLLSRGPRALKEEAIPSEREAHIYREGSLTTLRRVRIGQRDLIKLDLVEARLREAGPGFEARMSALAEEVADVIAGYAEGLPPRTLLFVFGDHGFYLPTGGPDATGPADQGNATPEEVLIGAQAWMIGAGS